MTATKCRPEEAVTRAVAILLIYREEIEARMPLRRARMRAEVRALGLEAASWGWDDERIEGRVIGPLAETLASRLGDEVGQALLDEFLVEFARMFD